MRHNSFGVPPDLALVDIDQFSVPSSAIYQPSGIISESNDSVNNKPFVCEDTTIVINNASSNDNAFFMMNIFANIGKESYN